MKRERQSLSLCFRVTWESSWWSVRRMLRNVEFLHSDSASIAFAASNA